MLDVDIAKNLVEAVQWHHDWEIIPGVRTNGAYNPELLWKELRLPDDMKESSLADIGASNGYFTFESDKRGARVTAFDFRHKDNSGFGLAQHINGMNHIRHHQVNVLDLNPEIHGRYDIVLALGLVYHIADPYRALANCASLSKRFLFVESYCMDNTVPDDMRNKPILVFVTNPSRRIEYSLGNDLSNFFGFTSACLQYMIEDIGFAIRRKVIRGERVMFDCERTSAPLTRLDIAYGVPSRKGLTGDPNDPKSWHVF